MGFEANVLWGEIAIPLGKESAFSKFWKGGPKSVRGEGLDRIDRDQWTLILLDGLSSYRREAHCGRGDFGSGYNAFSEFVERVPDVIPCGRGLERRPLTKRER